MRRSLSYAVAVALLLMGGVRPSSAAEDNISRTKAGANVMSIDDTGAITIPQLTSCLTLQTDSNGKFSCGAGGGAHTIATSSDTGESLSTFTDRTNLTFSHNFMTVADDSGGDSTFVSAGPGQWIFISSFAFAGINDVTFSNLAASTTYKVDFLISNSDQAFLAVQFNGDTSSNYDSGGEYLKSGPISNLWGSANKAACTISQDNNKALAGGDWIGKVVFQHWGQLSVISLRGDIVETKDDVGLLRRYDMGCRQDSLSTLSSIKFFPADDHTTPDQVGTISGEASIFRLNR